MRLEGDGLIQVAEFRSGGSYLSHNDMRVHFGLGRTTRVPPIRVRWPDGSLEQFDGLKANQIQVTRQGTGRAGAPLSPGNDSL